MTDELTEELERLCKVYDITIKQDPHMGKYLLKNGQSALITWKLIMNQHRNTIHYHHKDDCYFISDAYYDNDDAWRMKMDCDCPRTVIPADPQGLARSLVMRLLENVRTSNQKVNKNG